MKILYFAWLRQRTGIGEEDVSPPESVRDVASLVDWLKQRNPAFAEALADTSTLRVAVNQEFASFDTALNGTEEVALFPPMTGG
ncbi:MAG: molybdopterin converting factor subunit 1 [Rhodospirillaceae bacterium]|jgi:molybdopterin synthase sulfur carrier subunit|nr:molybdopterin converting factor subunit 1 [Rhodospirillaceae bacterium]MDD9918906.1 molybdopterin converting factor subunit 1 [Rhodospirillaceae bacterium]MDD9924343.1 molybdopterin converting factor subunit 1 [Rhodospirillaceae bacterium]|tara:strand:+ start:369 stop:620 length:252 start_codon:yes stop_codon:yes gene_type:complete